MTEILAAAAAVQLTEDADWEAIAEWAGGRLYTPPFMTEPETQLVLADNRIAFEGDWLIKTGGQVVITSQSDLLWPEFGPASPETMLRTMHAKFGLHGGWMPPAPTADLPDGLMATRWELIDEEVNRELRPAMEAGDLHGIADGIADAVVTLVGTAVVCGLPFDVLLREVHASNMTKTNDPGQPKLVKGPGYQAPRIAEVLAQEWR